MSRAAAHYHTVTKRDLSPRQREVLALVADGKTNGEIAERLGISLDGAKWHVSEILAKLGVATREEAADWWRERQGIGHVFSRMARAASPLLSWKVAAPVVGLAGMGLAVMFVLGELGDQGNAESIQPCTVDDVILEPVEGTGVSGGPVSIAITARARELPCTFEGTVTAELRSSGQLVNAPVRFDRAERTIAASRTILGWVTWSGGCDDTQGRVELRSGLVHAGEEDAFIESALPFVVGRPNCSDFSQVGVPRSFLLGDIPLNPFPPPALGPDPLDAVYCYPSDPAALARWLRPCQAIDALQPGLNSNDLDVLMEMLQLQETRCPPSFDSFPPSVCDGAEAGEVRFGIPLTNVEQPGSRTLSREQFRTEFLAMIESAKEDQLYRTRVTTVACADDPCTRFILGIANDGAPAAAYLRFEVDGDTFRVTSVGFGGEDALILRRGGEMRLTAGSATLDQFVPIVGPY